MGADVEGEPDIAADLTWSLRRPVDVETGVLVAPRRPRLRTKSQLFAESVLWMGVLGRLEQYLWRGFIPYPLGKLWFNKYGSTLIG